VAFFSLECQIFADSETQEDFRNYYSELINWIGEDENKDVSLSDSIIVSNLLP
jgi:hypothetical protein